MNDEALILQSFLASAPNDFFEGFVNWLQYFNNVGSKSLVAAYNSGGFVTQNFIYVIYSRVRTMPLDQQRNEIRDELKVHVNPDPLPQQGGKRFRRSRRRRQSRPRRRSTRRM